MKLGGTEATGKERRGKWERREKKEEEKKKKGIKYNFFLFKIYAIVSLYWLSELVLIQAHCSCVSKILPFEIFDGVAFFVCWW